MVDQWTSLMTGDDWNFRALRGVAPPVDLGPLSRYLFYRFGIPDMRPQNEDLTISEVLATSTVYSFDRARWGNGKGVLFIEFKIGYDEPRNGQKLHLEKLDGLSPDASAVIIYLSGKTYTDRQTGLSAYVFDPTAVKVLRGDGWAPRTEVPREDVLIAIGNFYRDGMFRRM
jgi:hypothetical protein